MRATESLIAHLLPQMLFPKSMTNTDKNNMEEFKDWHRNFAYKPRNYKEKYAEKYNRASTSAATTSTIIVISIVVVLIIIIVIVVQFIFLYLFIHLKQAIDIKFKQ